MSGSNPVTAHVPRALAAPVMAAPPRTLVPPPARGPGPSRFRITAHRSVKLEVLPLKEVA